MANTAPYGSMLHIPPTNYNPLAAKEEPYQKASRNEKYWRIFWKNIVWEWASRQRKREDRKSNGSRQKNKRGDSKVKSNDSPEIPDMGWLVDSAVFMLKWWFLNLLVWTVSLKGDPKQKGIIDSIYRDVKKIRLNRFFCFCLKNNFFFSRFMA